VSNELRKRSEFEYVLSDEQFEVFLEIAAKQDRPIEEVILGALDEYIAREKASCGK
jgi:hypothetical protein